MLAREVVEHVEEQEHNVGRNYPVGIAHCSTHSAAIAKDDNVLDVHGTIQCFLYKYQVEQEF